MKQYEAPQCEVSPLDLETDFMNSATGGGFPVNPVDPFGNNSNGIMEEDEEYE